MESHISRLNKLERFWTWTQHLVFTLLEKAGHWFNNPCLIFKQNFEVYVHKVVSTQLWYLLQITMKKWHCFLLCLLKSSNQKNKCFKSCYELQRLVNWKLLISVCRYALDIEGVWKSRWKMNHSSKFFCHCNDEQRSTHSKAAVFGVCLSFTAIRAVIQVFWTKRTPQGTSAYQPY